MAESYEILQAVIEPLNKFIARLGCEFYFKASFDKANRTSIKSYRGPGWQVTRKWFEKIKSDYGCKILTDVHETSQVNEVAEVCDALQIPAFLCRQTDLIVAAAQTNCFVNIKKGQFMAPASMAHIVEKVVQYRAERRFSQEDAESSVALTERGAFFGYGDLVVDMRSLAIMKEASAKVFFDITHSVQQPPTGLAISGGMRKFAPILARAAAACGYIDGIFLEIHPKPNQALSDASSQLSIEQGLALIEQVISIWKQARDWAKIDKDYHFGSAE